MRSDIVTPPDDLGPRPQASPTGGHTFMCGACNTPRLMLGRKKRLMRGLSVYICAACVARFQEKK